MQPITSIYRFRGCWNCCFPRLFFVQFLPDPATKLQIPNQIPNFFCHHCWTCDLSASNLWSNRYFRYIWMSLIGVTLFMTLAFGVNCLNFWRLGVYNPVTALYSAIPDGVMESVTLVQRPGWHTKLLTTQMFLGVIVVIVLISTAMSLWLNPSVSVEAKALQPKVPLCPRPR